MVEKQLVFANNKETGKFDRYHIIEKPKAEVENLVEKVNNNPESKSTARIIDDPDVLAAILRKESAGSIKSYCKDVENSVSSISEQISFLESEISSFLHKAKDQLDNEDKPTDETK